MQNKNIVIGAGVGYGVNHLQNFVKSFRSVNKEDACAIVISEANRDSVIDFFNEYDVIPIIWESYPFMKCHIQNTRHLAILEYLANNPVYKNVFLSDTRDVIFQINPFQNLEGDFLYFFQEAENFKISDDLNCNSYWILSAYNEEVLKELQPYNIICSGTILGSYDETLQLLYQIKNEYIKIKNAKPNEFEYIILDQAVVNYIARTMGPNNPNVTVKRNGDIVASLAISLGHQELSNDKLAFYEGLLMINNDCPAIIHQYDRDPGLTHLYNLKFQ